MKGVWWEENCTYSISKNCGETVKAGNKYCPGGGGFATWSNGFRVWYISGTDQRTLKTANISRFFTSSGSIHRTSLACITKIYLAMGCIFLLSVLSTWLTQLKLREEGGDVGILPSVQTICQCKLRKLNRVFFFFGPPRFTVVTKRVSYNPPQTSSWILLTI